MPGELNLRFTEAKSVVVRFGSDDDGTRQLPFENPLSDRDLHDLQWYVETYGAHSLGDPDDHEASRISGHLPAWGTALFRAVFTHREARRRLIAFRKSGTSQSRLLTISSEHPTILSLPWELLYDPDSPAGYLSLGRPRTSIRRRVAEATGRRTPFKVVKKKTLHLLFVVSRPAQMPFIDPRADAQAVLNAIDDYVPGRISCEFLRPPTLQALIERLEDKTRPGIDIIHFDGHGIYDRYGDPDQRPPPESIERIGGNSLLRDARFDLAEHPGIGYLLFEDEDGDCDYVPAAKLGANLHRHHVALVILSACRSAMVANSKSSDTAEIRPMDSVAARLTATGIPSVIAMTYSVLVQTTQVLFGTFYKELSQRRSIGEALDEARRSLASDPVKYEVQRRSERIPLRLYDWFLPALYQPGVDMPLLRDPGASAPGPPVAQRRSDVPAEPATCFFGRRRELWNIERWLTGPMRRISITGFGGQGKTALAQEAARWLMRIGLFEAAVFIDYSKTQGGDAVAVAVNNIGAVLDQTVVDVAAVTRTLTRTATLLVLDNLESLPEESLRPLLDAAVEWSETGRCRVLCTTRRANFEHTGYGHTGASGHRVINLAGLGSRQSPDETLEWFSVLSKIPPVSTLPPLDRNELIELFDRVDFHPLSIRVLAQQLKSRRPQELGDRLEKLLSAASTLLGEDTPPTLVASIQLSLDQLSLAAREALPRLGVFKSGAFENDLLVITGLGGPAGEDIPTEAGAWLMLRHQLEESALIETESVPDVAVPFVRFHSTLAPMLWLQLGDDERTRLQAAHRQRYFMVSKYLYLNDLRDADHVRSIARYELPNLIHAAHGALQDGDPGAMEFANSVAYFLYHFGLKKDSELLIAATSGAEPGSMEWYWSQSNLGDQLWRDGRLNEAATILQSLLAGMDERTRPYDRAVTLLRVARCYRRGQPEIALRHLADAIDVCAGAQQEHNIERLRAFIEADRGEVLMALGRFTEASDAYDRSLSMQRKSGGGKRAVALAFAQRGTVALMSRRFDNAERDYRKALALFRSLKEPEAESGVWHQLGRVFQEREQWEKAERHYREAARIREDIGIITGENGAATTWNLLAILNDSTGNRIAAEAWCRKALHAHIEAGEPNATSLHIMASILVHRDERLPEARRLLQEALALWERHPSEVSERWVTYTLLAEIEEREADLAIDADTRNQVRKEAIEHRALAREAKLAYPGTRYELAEDADLIKATVDAVHGGDGAFVNRMLEERIKHGWTNLALAIRRVLSGERDVGDLFDGLDLEDSVILEVILRGMADARILDLLLPQHQTKG